MCVCVNVIQFQRGQLLVFMKISKDAFASELIHCSLFRSFVHKLFIIHMHLWAQTKTHVRVFVEDAHASAQTRKTFFIQFKKSRGEKLKVK